MCSQVYQDIPTDPQARRPGTGNRAAVHRDLLGRAHGHAVSYLDGIDDRPAGAEWHSEQIRSALGEDLPGEPEDPRQTLDRLAAAGAGTIANAGPRYFGFVNGATLPVAVAADWLVSAWDQNAGLFVTSPTAAVAEDLAGRWLGDLLNLPASASAGFVTGAQAANFTGLAAARHHLLSRRGWDVEQHGLFGAPEITVVASAERHVTIDRALRLLGMGTSRIVGVACDAQGRMLPGALDEALSRTRGPVIVCAQAGNVNTGAVDPLELICYIAHRYGAWVHVDGAFGLWAAAAPSTRELVRGVERADSWATDAHKWLNAPYDCGIVFCAYPDAHRAAMTAGAPYLVTSTERDAVNWNPEFSRRARAVPVYAALRSLGRIGVAELVERCRDHAKRFAEILAEEQGVEILNEVVLNQVLVRFLDPGGDHDARTRAVITRVQEDGTCWLGGTTWHGMAAMRISVSSWATTTADVEASAAAILRAASRQRS